jgi:NAD(P)-dependent dehydrogenase (short-subunit alcohol dehydrogenase family)
MVAINPNGKLRGNSGDRRGRGIGEAIAVRLPWRAKVVVSARTAEEGDNAAPWRHGRPYPRGRREATAIKADLSAKPTARLLKEAVEAHGDIDILVNDAAVTFIPVETFPKKPT